MKDKRLKKIKQHYDILINGKKIKIMNHMISDGQIRLITKVRGQEFPGPHQAANIEIHTEQEDIAVNATWMPGGGITPTSEEYRYRILD